MKYLIPFFCFFLLVSGYTYAQQPHFIYLQTDNNQPFYVLLKNKNYSSSAIGYVILPKLENGDYRIKIGFAKNDMPEQDYLLKVKDNDQGYLIKNFGEKGSGIFNLQTLAIQYNGEIGKQLDAVVNTQREAERQKVLLQHQKDSTEKAEAALAEQQKIDNEAKLAAAAAKEREEAITLIKRRTEDSTKAVVEAQLLAVNQKKEADALAKQQAADSIKNEKEAKLELAKQKKEAMALAKQHSLDSIKTANTEKIAALKQKKEAEVLAKHQTDSIDATQKNITNPSTEVTETLTQKKVRLAKEKKVSDALVQQQKTDSIKTENAAKSAAAKQKKEAALLAKHQSDSIAVATKTAFTEPATGMETLLQKKARLAKEKREVDSLIEQQRIDSIKTVAANKLLLAKQRKEALALVQQQKIDSIKTATATKLALAKQKKDADLLIKQQKADSIKTENANLAIATQKKKDAAEALAQQQAEEQTKLEQQNKIDALAMQKKMADDLKRKKDSLATTEKKMQKEEPTSVLVSKNTNATIVYEPTVLSRVTTDSGTIMTYKIPSSKGWDTVTAFIKTPLAEKKIAVKNNSDPTKPSGVKFLDMHFNQDSADKANDLITPVFNEGKSAQKSSQKDEKPAKNATNNIQETVSTINQINNSNCRAEANEKDFYALRKKMVTQNDVDNMIIVAKKSMHEKCYSTIQIRNLSALMITDAERYQFLEAAYPFASDAYNYNSLADLLKDNYYVDRFKAMLKR